MKKFFNNRVLVVVIIIIVILLIIGGSLIYQTIKYKNVISSIVIENLKLEDIPDGTYSGSFDAIMVGAEVSVTVKDHKIIDIVIKNHKNGRGKQAEIITEKVIMKQSLDVDTIAGATGSSKVILKAIENALNNN